jgi:hypothetical protein
MTPRQHVAKIEYQDPATPVEAGQDGIDLSSFVEELTELAKRPTDEPVVLMAGKFAMYPMADGGVMFVTECPIGVFATPGVNRTRIPPAMLRALAVIFGGGSKMGALRAALRGGKQPKALGDGR